MIDKTKSDAVPAEPGPPVVVGTCELCGSNITKQFVVRTPPDVSYFAVVCTKGGVEHIQQLIALTVVLMQTREAVDGKKRCGWCGKEHDAPGVFCYECY